MAIIGKTQRLRVIKEVDFGIYLDGGDDGEILMPKRYVPTDAEPDTWLEAFVYLDSEDRLIATTEKPLAEVGTFGYMKVVSVNSFGAFLDWGLLKDLLVPFRKQKDKMIEQRSYAVYVYEDPTTRRIAATSEIDKYLDLTFPEYETGDEVDLLIAQQTDLGFKAIVDDRFWGLIFHSDVFNPLTLGQRTVGYIKHVREDGRIDLQLHKIGYDKVGDIAPSIYEALKANRGYLAFTDKSPAEQIYARFGVSKKTFKKALGDLYKKRMIRIAPDGIYIVAEE